LQELALLTFGHPPQAFAAVLIIEIIASFEMNQNEPVNLDRMMNVSILNALWVILVGEKMDLVSTL
jgi:hypothetical protein